MEQQQQQKRMVNSPFPRQPRSMGFVQGRLVFNRQAFGSEMHLPAGDGFIVCWNPSKGGFLRVEHRSEPGRILWSSAPGSSFVTAAMGVEKVEEFRGSFGIHEETKMMCKHQSVDKIVASAGSNVVEEDHTSLSCFGYDRRKDGDGTLLSASGASVAIGGILFADEVAAMREAGMHTRRLIRRSSVAVRYTLCFSEKRSHHLGFSIRLEQPFSVSPPLRRVESFADERELSRDVDVLERLWSERSLFGQRRKKVRPMEQSFEQVVPVPVFNRVQLTFLSHRRERFFGFGEQFSCFDLKGRRVPVLVQEQGLGRGDQPITAAANILSYRSGGSWHTTYAPSPYYMTSDMRCLFLENYEYSVFDLRRQDRVQIQVHSGTMEGRILHGQSPAELLLRYTGCVGRMRDLPDWIHQGAIVGMQGGTTAVRKIHDELKKHDVPVAAFWLQDWVGQRKTNIGWQLWWNWEADLNHYQGWTELIKELKTQGIRTMTYCNPFLACVESKETKRRDMLQEAKVASYLVNRHNGDAYMVKNTNFDAGIIDLTNPEARSWLKEILREMIRGGVSGWMADFGEALPFDAILHSDENPALLHNRFPELWAELNREVVEEWEREQKLQNGDVEQLVFFMRAGFSRSPRWSTLFWEGDQMVSWQRNDGIKSAVVGLLSGGISGYSLNHSDIGGYTTVNVPFLLKYVRTEELLMRWMELNAFSVIFRTHEGNDPEANSQFYSNSQTLQHFSRCAKMFKAWECYRKELVKEAATCGLPVVRHLFIHYPQDVFVRSITYEQFLVGSEILVVPVLDKGKRNVRAYFPAGDVWMHIWTNKKFGSKSQASSAWIDAPLGFPAVFVKVGSAVQSINTFISNLVSFQIPNVQH